MIAIVRPGLDPLEIDSLLIDFEGTLAMDGRVHPKVKDKLNLLAKRVQISILIGEETEKVKEALKRVKAEIVPVAEGQASQEKLRWLHRLGPNRTAAIGNGFDDGELLEKAALGLAVLSREGTAASTWIKADLLFPTLLDALDFLLKPLRQKATLKR